MFGAAASAGGLTADPRDPLDALTIAYAAAVYEVLEGRLAQLLRERPTLTQARLVATEPLARRLRTTGDTLEATLNGRRWVTLRDVLAALEQEMSVAPLFRDHLCKTSTWFFHLLHKDAPEHPTLTPARVASDIPADRVSVDTQANPSRQTEADVHELERRAREAVAALVAAQQRARARGLSLPSGVDWIDVAAQHGLVDEQSDEADGEQRSPRTEDPTDTGNLDRGAFAEYGIENMNAAVREVFRGGETLTSAQVVERVQSAARERMIDRGLPPEPVPPKKVQTSLWRLHTQPPDADKRWLVRVGRKYRPGPRMLRGEGEPE